MSGFQLNRDFDERIAGCRIYGTHNVGNIYQRGIVFSVFGLWANLIDIANLKNEC